MIGEILALISSVLNALGTVIQKKGIEKAKRMRRVFKSRTWILGIVLSAVSFVIYFIALNFQRLSIVQPIVNSFLVFVPIFSYFILGEKISKTQAISILIILLGITLLVI